MGATRHISDFKIASSDESKHCYRLAISNQSRAGAIRIRHLGKNGEILSECMLPPEDAFDYAQAVLEAYDHAENISPYDD